MLKKNELLQGNAQDQVVSDLKDILVMTTIEDVHDRLDGYRTIELAEEVNDVCKGNVDKALSIMKILESLGNEATETLEFLIKRNASKESIAGMSVLVYHATNAYNLAEEIARSIQGTDEVGL